MADHTPTERPEDKDLQDHTFGMKAAEKLEEADRAGAGATSSDDKRPTEPHAGGKA